MLIGVELGLGEIMGVSYSRWVDLVMNSCDPHDIM